MRARGGISRRNCGWMACALAGLLVSFLAGGARAQALNLSDVFTSTAAPAAVSSGASSASSSSSVPASSSSSVPAPASSAVPATGATPPPPALAPAPSQAPARLDKSTGAVSSPESKISSSDILQAPAKPRSDSSRPGRAARSLSEAGAASLLQDAIKHLRENRRADACDILRDMIQRLPAQNASARGAMVLLASFADDFSEAETVLVRLSKSRQGKPNRMALDGAAASLAWARLARKKKEFAIARRFLNLTESLAAGSMPPAMKAACERTQMELFMDSNQPARALDLILEIEWREAGKGPQAQSGAPSRTAPESPDAIEGFEAGPVVDWASIGGKAAETLAQLTEPSAALSDDPDWLSLKGRSAFIARRYPESRAALDRLADLFPEHPGALEALGSLGLMAELQGNNEAAMDYYTRYLLRAPKGPNAQWILQREQSLRAPYYPPLRSSSTSRAQ